MIRGLVLVIAAIWTFWVYYLPKVDVPYVPDWMIPGASCTTGPPPPGGTRALASDVGSAIRTVMTEPPPDATEIRSWLVTGAGKAGTTWGTFEAALAGRPYVPPTQQVTTPTPVPSSSGAALAARAAAAAGWLGDDLTMAVAVAGAESGFDPAAANPSSSARGLWQVMTSVHADKIGGRDILDPYVNAEVAYAIWQEADRTWQPWVVAGSGAYRAWLDEARTAVASLPGTGVVPAGFTPTADCEPGVIPAAGDPGAAGVVIERAKTYLGTPYIRGGNDPAVGIDCSRLTELAFEAVGIDLPPVSWMQVDEGVAVSGLSAAVPGDLIFYGAPITTHVALYLGGGEMIHAPRPGKVVEIVDVYGSPSFIRRVLVGGVTA